MNNSLDTISATNWLSQGGITFDGQGYLSPKSAIPWGQPGCPLVPRQFRQHFGDTRIQPRLSVAIGAPRICLSELDSDAYFRFDLENNSERVITAISGIGYRIPDIADEVAIPGGIPLDWLVRLPVNARVLNGLRRMYSSRDWGTFSKEPLFCRDVLSVYGLGVKSLLELLCVIESTESGGRHSTELGKDGGSDRDAEEITMTRAQFEHLEKSIAVSASELAAAQVSTPAMLLRTFSSWALAETTTTSLGSALQIALGESILSEDVTPLFGIDLKDFVSIPDHPYSLIQDWLRTLTERENAIFIFRLFPAEGRMFTLEELGAQFSVSRERIRQIANKLSRKFEAFLKGPVGRPIRWRCEHIRSMIGAAAPKDQVEHLLAAPAGTIDFRAVLISVADYEAHSEWFISKTARYADPVADIALMADKHGRVDEEKLTDALNEWGLSRGLHERWMLQSGRVQEMPSGRFYLNGTSISDRMVANLADIGYAVTIDTLIEYRNEDRSVYSVKNAIASDPRIVRVSRTKWGLKEWDAPEYESVASAIRHLLMEGGPLMHIDQIAGRLQRDFSVAENTVRTYCSNAPMFVIESDYVRLRENDEPFIYEEGLLGRKSGQGVFSLGYRKLGLLIQVDADTKRGSGQRLSMAGGELLGLQPNDQLVFFDSEGNDLRVSFLDSSLIGPQLGSVRSLIGSTEAGLGDWLTLILDREDMSFTSWITDASLHDRGWDLIASLTGIDAASGLDGLAKALLCGNNSVRAVLNNRGDTVVRDALPDLPHSVDLDEALASLEEQLSLNYD